MESRRGIKYPHDLSTEEMVKRVLENQIELRMVILDYEVRSSMWAGWLCFDWCRGFAGWYYGRKVSRKFARYIANKAVQLRVLKIRNTMGDSNV